MLWEETEFVVVQGLVEGVGFCEGLGLVSDPDGCGFVEAVGLVEVLGMLDGLVLTGAGETVWEGATVAQGGCGLLPTQKKSEGRG